MSSLSNSTITIRMTILISFLKYLRHFHINFSVIQSSQIKLIPLHSISIHVDSILQFQSSSQWIEYCDLKRTKIVAGKSSLLLFKLCQFISSFDRNCIRWSLTSSSNAMLFHIVRILQSHNPISHSNQNRSTTMSHERNNKMTTIKHSKIRLRTNQKVEKERSSLDSIVSMPSESRLISNTFKSISWRLSAKQFQWIGFAKWNDIDILVHGMWFSRERSIRLKPQQRIRFNALQIFVNLSDYKFALRNLRFDQPIASFRSLQPFRSISPSRCKRNEKTTENISVLPKRSFRKKVILSVPMPDGVSPTR